MIKILTIEDIRKTKEPPAVKKIRIDSQRGVCTLSFRGRYEIDLDRLKNEKHLLFWIWQLSEKSWMNLERMHYFIKAIAEYRGFLGMKKCDNQDK